MRRSKYIFFSSPPRQVFLLMLFIEQSLYVWKPLCYRENKVNETRATVLCDKTHRKLQIELDVTTPGLEMSRSCLCFRNAPTVMIHYRQYFTRRENKLAQLAAPPCVPTGRVNLDSKHDNNRIPWLGCASPRTENRRARRVSRDKIGNNALTGLAIGKSLSRGGDSRTDVHIVNYLQFSVLDDKS